MDKIPKIDETWIDAREIYRELAIPSSIIPFEVWWQNEVIGLPEVEDGRDYRVVQHGKLTPFVFEVRSWVEKEVVYNHLGPKPESLPHAQPKMQEMADTGDQFWNEILKEK